MHFLAEHAQKYAQGQNFKTGWLTEKAFKEFKSTMIFWKN